MKVLAIDGSARSDGNTALLIRTVFEELEKEGIETEMVCLAGQNLEPCRACWACGGRGNCVNGRDAFGGNLRKDEESRRYPAGFSGILRQHFLQSAGGTGTCGGGLRYECRTHAA